jgi:hypothetical protein
MNKKKILNGYTQLHTFLSYRQQNENYRDILRGQKQKFLKNSST